MWRQKSANKVILLILLLVNLVLQRGAGNIFPLAAEQIYKETAI